MPEISRFYGIVFFPECSQSQAPGEDRAASVRYLDMYAPGGRGKRKYQRWLPLPQQSVIEKIGHMG